MSTKGELQSQSQPCSWRDYDWSDLPPLFTGDDNTMLARITYSDDFAAAMAQFRAVAAAGERSERVLALTRAVIELNPAHYSVWDYRIETAREVGNDVFDYRKHGSVTTTRPPIGEDVDWINRFTLDNPKNYQVWNYRRHLEIPMCIEWYLGERLIVDTVLEDDAKNFHAWSHLKWAISQCPKAFDPKELLTSIDSALMEDVYNNSVWSFRFFIGSLYGLSSDAYDDELNWARSHIDMAPDNEAAWGYLCGLARAHSHDPVTDIVDVASKYDTPRAVEALATVAPSPELYKRLIEVEPVRAKLWHHRLTALDK